jgi:hypothetical protein
MACVSPLNVTYSSTEEQRNEETIDIAWDATWSIEMIGVI